MSGTIMLPLETPADAMFCQMGLISDRQQIPSHLALFVAQAEDVLEKVRQLIARGELPSERGGEFLQLLLDACARVLCHPIVANNQYLTRFAEGITEAQARHECQQFSVFALQFDVAQAKLVSNAPTYEAYVERLQVLLNEKGIPYQDGFEGELTGLWKQETVHFSWMLNMARGLGLKFEDLGKIWVGLAGTRAFADATFKYYASTDQCTAGGAAFAIENWAANSLWKPWIAGMEKLNAKRTTPINLGYLKYHDLEEQHHSQATLDELLENFVEPWFDSNKFLEGAETMLTEGVQAYYSSQLETLPDKDASWPSAAFAPRGFDPTELTGVSR